SDNTLVVSNYEAELVEAIYVVETTKPSKPKRVSKKVTKKPKVINVTSDNTPVVSNDDAEPVEALDVVETTKPSKPKRESKRVSTKPKIIAVSVDNTTIHFDNYTTQTEQPEPHIETATEPTPKAKSTPKKQIK
ncbi:MAG: hypothetical protein ACKPKO_28950, partial [Candidatus Fonsibacter sp.]